MSITYRLVTELSELEAHSDAWEAVLGRSVDMQVTQSPDWHLAWLRLFGGEAGRELRVLFVYDKSRLVGVIPLAARRYVYPPGLSLQRLELLPSGEDEYDEICSDYIGPTVARGSELAVARVFADALISGSFGAWDELVMPAMSVECAAWVPIASELRARRTEVHVEVTNGCPYASLPATFEEYVLGLSPSRRQLVRRSLADFEAWNGGPAVLERATNDANLAVGIAILTQLHGTRWSAAGQAGVFSASRFRAFHDDIMPRLLARGRLELAWLRGRGEPIAANYGLIADGRIQIYQSGRAVDLPKELRPGIVSHAAAMRDAIARGAREYDFLAGASRYKTELASATRALVCLRATHGTPAEMRRRAAALAIDTARTLRDAVTNQLSGAYKRKGRP